MKRAARTLLTFTLLAGLTILFTGCAATGPAGSGQKAAAPAKAEAGWKYVCACGLDCKCGTSANKPGDCTCGKPMAYKKILREDATYWWVCSCKDCNCTGLDPKDSNKCSCGEPLKAYPKHGNYACDCPNCDCGTQSRNPGKCLCGKEMKAQ